MRKFTQPYRPSDPAELSSWYEAMFEEAERRDLSMRELSEEVGISFSTLYAWRRRLSNGDTNADDESPSLLEVRLRSDEPDPGRDAGGEVPLVLRLRGGRQIEVPCGFDASDLVRLVEVLESC